MDRHLRIAQNLADVLDNKFQIFGFRFGIDPIIGFIPVAGDILPILIGCYMAWIGWKYNLPGEKIFRIIFNTTLDSIIGFLPVIGDFGDFVYKSHTRNLEILKSHIPDFENNIIEGIIVE